MPHLQPAAEGWIGGSPDAYLKKRFPAWDAVAPAQMSLTETRLQELLIADGEAVNKTLLGLESNTISLKAGSLVHNPKLGVTMLAMETSNCRRQCSERLLPLGRSMHTRLRGRDSLLSLRALAIHSVKSP